MTNLDTDLYNAIDAAYTRLGRPSAAAEDALYCGAAEALTIAAAWIDDEARWHRGMRLAPAATLEDTAQLLRLSARRLAGDTA